MNIPSIQIAIRGAQAASVFDLTAENAWGLDLMVRHVLMHYLLKLWWHKWCAATTVGTPSDWPPSCGAQSAACAPKH